MGTREAIVQCARELFMQKGYNNVSVRDIAEAAGIRVGNLTYHFPRKELLVEAIYSGTETKMYTPEALAAPEDFRAYFRHLLAVQRRADFYFDSYVQLSQTSEYFRDIQLRRIEALRGLFLSGLKTLAASGAIAPERREGEFSRRTENLLTALLLRLPGEERQFAPPETDEAAVERLMELAGIYEEEGRGD